MSPSTNKKRAKCLYRNFRRERERDAYNRTILRACDIEIVYVITDQVAAEGTSGRRRRAVFSHGLSTLNQNEDCRHEHDQ